MSPLDQFNEITILYLLKSSWWIIISVIILIGLISKINLLMNNKSVTVISILDSIIVTTYNQISTLKYYPLIVSITLYVLIQNLIGNIPYGYANTSSIIVCLGLSVALWISILCIIVYRYKVKILSFFIPEGTPLILVPLLTLIEVVSYISRSLSLGVRLFSNIVAGHVLIHLISGFIYTMITKGLYWAVILLLPFIIFLSLVGLELAVSFIQAYVFLLLISSYLRDSIYLH